MSKLGAQVTTTDPTTDYSYLVTQLESITGGKYSETGGIIWIDRSTPNSDDRLKQAVLDCLANKFTGHIKR